MSLFFLWPSCCHIHRANIDLPSSICRSSESSTPGVSPSSFPGETERTFVSIGVPSMDQCRPTGRRFETSAPSASDLEFRLGQPGAWDSTRTVYSPAQAQTSYDWPEAWVFFYQHFYLPSKRLHIPCLLIMLPDLRSMLASFLNLLLGNTHRHS